MNTIILKEKFAEYLRTAPDLTYHDIADSLITILVKHLADEKKKAEEASAEFDRDRYADDNRGWTSAGFVDSNGWKHV